MNDRRFPQRPDSHQLEELSRRFFAGCLPRSWLSEPHSGDYGVDLRVDLFDGDKATGLELLVQLKASARPDGGDSECIRLKTTTLNYLREKIQIVVLVKFIESDNEAYWVWLKDVAPPLDESQETVTVRIPKHNRLSTIDWNRVQGYVREVTDRKLAAQRAWLLEQAGNPATE